MKHPEITCPYCRIQFGGYKVMDNKLVHLDIAFTADAGLTVDCLQSDYILSQTTEIDDYQNPVFPAEFNSKLKELQEAFLTNPIDISKDNFDFGAFRIAFRENLSYGEVMGEDEEIIKGLKWQFIEDMYNSGTNLYDCIRACVTKSE